MDWKNVLVQQHTSILDTIKVIDEQASQMALVVDEELRLLGVVTDGDIRRALIRDIELNGPVSTIMNTSPMTVKRTVSTAKALELMRTKFIKLLPVLDGSGKVVDVFALRDILKGSAKQNSVVLMAGGLGTRLGALTQHSPKPLLKVGDKPILETIVDEFVRNDFSNIYISVNYKSEMIKAYFGDGSDRGANIQYVDEDKPLGTAGSLSLLPNKPQDPFFVMNGDLLTKVNFDQLLEYHNQHNSVATMCVREFKHQVPFGVIKADQHRLVSIEEKPMKKYFVNAGIYVLNPEVLELIPNDQFYDMPSLFEQLIAQQKEVSVYPIREYWIDIGHIQDYERANLEYYSNFL